MTVERAAMDFGVRDYITCRRNRRVRMPDRE